MSPVSESVAISVVVPTYLRARGLQNCLDDLCDQSLDGSAYEIIVVDDARSEQTRKQVEAIARRQRGKPRLRYLRPEDGRRGPAAARNAGWRAAAGEVIAFTDDDTLPTRDWLAEGFLALSPDIVAAWGKVVVPLPPDPTDAEKNLAGLETAEFVTANCFVRRAALEAAGGFDERFSRPWREDSDLYFTLLEQGGRVVHAPKAVVVHPPRQLSPAACLRQHRNLFFDALLFKKHPKLYRQKIAAAPPRRYYLAAALVLACLAALVAGRPQLATAAALAWVAFTVGLTVFRLRHSSRDWRNVLDVALTSAAIPLVAIYWRLAGALHFRVPFA